MNATDTSKAAPKAGNGHKVDAKELFSAYQAADDKVDAAQKSLEEAMVARSAAVKAIREGVGDGPFQWKGRVLKAFKRDSKAEDGTVESTTYYFREMGGELNVIG